MWHSCRKWAIWYENMLESRVPDQEMGSSETTEASEMKINKHLRGSSLCQRYCWECDAMKKKYIANKVSKQFKQRYCLTP